PFDRVLASLTVETREGDASKRRLMDKFVRVAPVLFKRFDLSRFFPQKADLVYNLNRPNPFTKILDIASAAGGDVMERLRQTTPFLSGVFCRDCDHRRLLSPRIRSEVAPDRDALLNQCRMGLDPILTVSGDIIQFAIGPTLGVWTPEF